MRPNFFIIGAPKCGTTALAHYLSEHPAVFFSEPKEPFYLSDDYPKLKEQHLLRELDDYLKLFKDAAPNIHQSIGEGSTNYLASKNAVSNAIALNPKAKFIVMLRNPVQVVHAYHMEQVWARNEDELNFESAWRLQSARKLGERIPRSCVAEQFLQYQDLATFSPQIKRLQAVVPAEQVLVLLLDDLKQDPAQVYRKVLKFLELEDDRRSVFPVVNPSHKHRYEWFADFILRPPRFLEEPMFRFRRWARLRRPWFIEAIKSMLRVSSRRREMSAEFERELYATFHSDVIQLEALIQRDLSSWKTPDPKNHMRDDITRA